MTGLVKIIPQKDHQNRIAEIDEEANKEGFWGEPKQAAALMKERQDLLSLLEALSGFQKELDFCQEYNQLDPTDAEINQRANQLEEKLGKFEIGQLLNGEMDHLPAILTLSAGAGGIEAANFTQLILRMYLRYCDKAGYKTELLDLKTSTEYSDECIDGASIRIDGDQSYGYFKGETGIFRLVRNSPYNAGNARHTSFASISVLPDIEDTIKIEIRDEDLEIHAVRSSKAGGQNTNKVSSCIVLKHLPSGIMIKSQSERSQLDNKRNAFRLLKAKLYDLEVKKKNAEKDKHIETQQDNRFGSQTRSFILSPYQLCVDHKSEFKVNNVEAVLDGDLYEFLKANLYIRS